MTQPSNTSSQAPALTPQQPRATLPQTAISAAAHRDLYWQNVIREMLSALAVAAAESSGRLTASAKSVESSTSPIDEMFDGRLGIITRQGQRIAIADVVPLFACSIPGQNQSNNDRRLSLDVQCSVYQIRTPNGEEFTLPVQEIVAFHSLSDQLVRKLEEAARLQAGRGSDPATAKRPFGFAAFTSIASAEQAEGESQADPDAGEQTQPSQG